MKYMNEMSKIKDKVIKYCEGLGIDIGCYDCKIKEGAIGIDGRKAEGVSLVVDSLYDLPIKCSDVVGALDYVFSSHVLEHMHDSYRAVVEWSSFLKPGGYFILYLPDANHYNNFENMEHMHNTEYKSFLMWFERVFCGVGKNFKGEQYMPPTLKLVEHGLDIGEDKYSFFVVSQKL